MTDDRKGPLIEFNSNEGARLGIFDAGPEGYKEGLTAVIASVHGTSLALFEVNEAAAEAMVEVFSLLLLRFEDAKDVAPAAEEAPSGESPAV